MSGKDTFYFFYVGVISRECWKFDSQLMFEAAQENYEPFFNSKPTGTQITALNPA